MDDPFATRQNSFSFLRFAFAAAVIFSHCCIGGFNADWLDALSAKQTTMGLMAVLGFFVVSGFLLMRSLAENPSLERFVIHRAARLLPAFWTYLLVIVFIAAPAIIAWQMPGRFGYWESLHLGPKSALNYLAGNWTIRADVYSISPLFRGTAVNGSLWTLYHEAMCYLGLALCAAAGGLRRTWITGSLFVAVYLVQFAASFDPMAVYEMSPLAAHSGQFLSVPSFRGLYLAFLGGVLTWQLRGRLQWSRGWFLFASAALIGSLLYNGFSIVWPFALPYLVIWLAQKLPLHGAERWGDFSYGLYIYAFPIQQILTLAGWNRWGLKVYFAASLLTTLAVAVVSWFLVERPSLRFGRWLARRCASRSKRPRALAVDIASGFPGAVEA
ncbi:MAG: hypothetical protein QOE70_2968 [Chthoniobacter sp.]|jgi:peptidoglycan/LPS O-acetylase OafA/YrhL|nr:hypothetical protein [Chthoniobacter sp.]